MSWVPPASDPNRRSASHDILRMRPSQAYHDIQEPQRIVSDDVMARNRGLHSPSSLTSFGESIYSQSNASQKPSVGSYPVNTTYEPDFEIPVKRESQFMETFSRTSSTSSRRVGVNEEDQKPLEKQPFLNSENVHSENIPSNVNSFSFSEADESAREFHFSPRLAYEDELENADFVSIKTLPMSQSEDETNTIQSSLPPKSLQSGNSNLVGLIIGKYDYSSSALALNPSVDTRGTAASLTSGSTYSSGSRPSFQPEIDQQRMREPVKDEMRSLQELNVSKRGEHLRNNSASSTLSTTSTASTLTKSNNQQRFLRYAMGAHSSQPALNPTTRWLMDNVISWLDFHNFNPSWKETFRRNEISGNRFLELGNYESSSMVWRQFSRSLHVGEDKSEVDRFIYLLRSELHNIENSSTNTSSTLAPPEIEVQKRAENRKSSATLSTQLSSSVPTKPRPYSYVEPSSSSKANPLRDSSQSHAHKFFRLHHRTPSTDSTKANASTASLSGDDPRNSTGQRMSGIFSSIWKYSGDKAAGIVKQVHPSSSSASGRQSSGNKRGSYVMPQHRRADLSSKNTSFMNRDSLLSLQRSQDDSTLSPISTNSTGFPPFDVNESSADSERLLSAEIKKETIDARYLPVPKGSLQDESKLILLSKDNVSFKPLRIYTKDLDDLESLKKRIYKSLDLLSFGLITFHLTDYDCIPGEAMGDDVIIQALRQNTLCKIHIQQIVNSPGTNTISSTSSDARSFDLTGDNNGRMYPATPQYLLQDARDKGIDYINFKDHEAFSQIKNPKDARGPTTPYQHPLKLTIPVNKRHSKKNLLQPNSSQQTGRKVEFTDLAQAHLLAPEVPETSKSGRSPDAKQQSNFASKDANAPLLEEKNSLSSKAIRSAIFREGATKAASRASSLGLEYERSSSFIAKRKAPPPPTGSVRSRTLLGASVLPALSRNSSGRRVTSKLASLRKQEEESNAFAEHEFSFDDAPSFSPASAKPPQMQVKPALDTSEDSDNDDFFIKPMSQKKSLAETTVDSDDEEDFFMKPTKNSRSAELKEMNVRPPVEEVYNNLEKYFPNTNLDKPIIDASPDSPVAQAISPKRSFPTQRKESISRTFSNANNSPINPPNDEDGVIPVENGGKPFKRMKTIRTVANEARNKRLAGQRANKKFPDPPAKTTDEKSSGLLRRSNTKLWGQKLIEVTSAEIEKGFVSRIRSSASSKFEEFAWIKGELIGRGSFGSVYLALNVTTGEMLAVKQVVVTNSWNKTSDGLDALHKEVETMKDLDHLNIVQYLGFEQKKNTYSLFLEYVGGGSISSCLKSFGKFDEPLVKFITRQVLDGLRYLHSNGILHRDLKADNLLLETDGTCKISDFGISKKSQDIYSNNAEMSMQGTVFWMAPEVIHNIVEDKKQGYSAKVDIWSLGCVVLEMFAGQRPWSNEAVISAIYKIGKTKLAPPIPDDVSDEAKDFLKQCFTTDSEIRPTAEKLLEHPFMVKDPSFRFNDTKLREVIKFNTRRV